MKASKSLDIEDSVAERKSLRAAAMKCERGIVDEGRTVETLISGLVEEGDPEDTDRQVGTWM